MELNVLKNIPADLKNPQLTHELLTKDVYAKTLGIEWNSHFDHFHLTVAELPQLETLVNKF